MMNRILSARAAALVFGTALMTTFGAFAEELEETAKLLVLLRGAPRRMLSPENVAELKAVFGRA